MVSTVRKKIRQMTRRIVKKFDPNKVILFGSYAKGTATKDSDADLLIVMPVSGSKREKGVEIGVELHDVHIPKDIIVTTPEEMERRKNIVGTIAYIATREGKVLYERQP